MKNDILYIGLHGFAGSGKDTVAKALRLMLSYNWESFEDFKTTWEKEAFKMSYATFGQEQSNEDCVCYCIAFADQLKHVCAAMFGIPIEHFYYNKENGWISISDNFEYTERQPNEQDIISAEEYYCWINSNNYPIGHKWMSLREVLVFIGTYVCQNLVNKDIFVNGVKNRVKMIAARNKMLKYIICTDVRFYHELDFIRQQNGINIDIIRSDVKQLDNVAEHDFDGCDDEFDFTINNDGTYDDLLHELWDTVHDNSVFRNNTIQLMTHDGSNNYLREISDNKYECFFEHGVIRTVKEHGETVLIDPIGGPSIITGNMLYNDNGKIVGKVSSISIDIDTGIYNICLV